VRGTIWRCLRRAVPLRPYSATYVWYELLIDSDRPRRELSPGLSLRSGSREDVGLVGQLRSDVYVSSLDAPAVVARLDQGATLWLVTQADRLAFACWIFRGSAPVWAARGGVIDLPSDVVCLEDSQASPAFQGRGIAPAAWSSIATRCGEQGASAMVTTVNEKNAASRRAVEKAGFREVARVVVSQRGWRTRLDVVLTEDEPFPRWLAAFERR